MRISIANFKSISLLEDFDLRPLTILSGTNSSGKSSLIQLLLLLKQTIEISSANNPLYLDGKLFSVRRYMDLVNSKSGDDKITCQFILDKTDFAGIVSPEVEVFENLNYECSIIVEFGYFENREIVRQFGVIFRLKDDENYEQFISFQNRDGFFFIESNTGVFDKDIFFEPGFEVRNLEYTAFYPSSYEAVWKLSLSDNPSEVQVKHGKSVPEISGIRTALNRFLKNIRYVGPFRIPPLEEYALTEGAESVGPSGEFTAQLLEMNSGREIEYITVSDGENGPIYNTVKGTFIEAINYWLCSQFGMARSIVSIRNGDRFNVVVESLNAVKTNVRHVGFGISQILPILVEGFLLPAGGTLILEQPEIHLHPKVQSKLFDFVYSIVRSGHRAIVETHSDHIITRLRRRVAEESNSAIRNDVNLSFVELNEEDGFSTTIFNLDEYGTSVFPQNFIESPEQELKAIIKAQMRKRLSK